MSAIGYTFKKTQTLREIDRTTEYRDNEYARLPQTLRLTRVNGSIGITSMLG